MLGKFGGTHNLGRPVKEAFSEKIQRRLATTVPPRPMAEMSFRDAVTKLEKMLQDIYAALLVEETGAFKDPCNLVNFLQFWNVREPLTFARATLQTWLFGDLKVAPSIEKLLLKDVKGLVLREDKLLDPINWTVEVPADSRHQIARLIDNFRQKASMDYQNMYQSLCQNRCRVRRNLCHVIQQFDQLQQEAEAIDTELHELSRENWIVEEDQEFEPIPYFPLTYWVYHHKLYSLLNYLKLLGGEDRPCSSDRLRYQLRMKPFFHISTPELPAYVDIWDPVYASGGSQEQCNKAEDALKTAKERITVLKSLGPQEMKYVGNEVEYQNRVRQMLRSCIATGLAIASVRAACAKYGSEDKADSLHRDVLRSVLNVEIPNPETRYAVQWVVPKITQTKAKS
ncbi:hypothetical protein B0A49_00708 [Cryomyces minteri]|uniref:NAA35-like TPR repeats domain-containing protein n=1 Tax=Cryomyces minteri TaxID=331657 RepID=A0A4V5NK81_9PEZI|nr:hypothetical protein B0A49_00708 [Cryomyces minteri]